MQNLGTEYSSDYDLKISERGIHTNRISIPCLLPKGNKEQFEFGFKNGRVPSRLVYLTYISLFFGSKQLNFFDLVSLLFSFSSSFHIQTFPNYHVDN